MISKIYWWFVDICMYIMLSLFFLLIILWVYFKHMLDNFCYKFFGKIDDICEWIAKKLAGKRCKCNSKKLEQEKILAVDKTFENEIKK
jgi:hypothetical protein